MILELILIIFGFIILIKSADVLVDGSGSIAKKLKISEMVIGLTIVAIGTSAPELSVSIKSAINGYSDIVIGNVLGSNIGNLFLIFGICVLINPIKMNKQFIKTESKILFLTYIILTFIYLIENKSAQKVIGIKEGIILIIGFILFVTFNFIKMKRDKTLTLESEIKDINVWKSTILIIIGILGLKIGGDFVVDNAVIIAEKLNISEKLISITVISLGTNLPELITCVTASKKNQAGILLGNLIGSQILNITLILGITILIRPINFSREYLLEIYLLLTGSFLFMVLSNVRKKEEITKQIGTVFLLIYIIYFLYLILKNIKP